MTTKKFISENQDRILDELFSLIRIPSVSAHSHHQPEILQCATQWQQLLLKAGADTAEILATNGNPVVFATKIIDPSYPTIMVYGHYDVMPAEPLDLWVSPPFEPEVRDGKIFARGADDDKGQSFMHLKAFEYLVSTQQLKCNVKFIIEGEEEVGSPNLEAFCMHYYWLAWISLLANRDYSSLSRFTFRDFWWSCSKSNSRIIENACIVE